MMDPRAAQAIVSLEAENAKLRTESEMFQEMAGKATKQLLDANLQVSELQKKLDLAYPVVEAARTVYEIQEKALSRGKSVGAVLAYEETREDHLAACEAMNKAVAAFNVKAALKPLDQAQKVEPFRMCLECREEFAEYLKATEKPKDRCKTCEVEIPEGHCRFTKGDLDFCGRCGVPTPEEKRNHEVGLGGAGGPHMSCSCTWDEGRIIRPGADCKIHG